MTNQQFTDYLQAKMDALMKMDPKDRPDGQEAMLTSALKIMTHSPGPARRRFKRDYERRMARQGKKLEG